MKALIVLLIMAFSLPVLAQDNNDQTEEDQAQEYSPKPSIFDKMYFGGSVGMGFGTNTFVDLSPLVGYRVTERFNVAAGLIYEYRNYKPWDISYSNYGGRLMGIYKIYEPLFGQIEYEYLNWEYYYTPEESERFNNNAVFVGGGISQPVGRNIFIVATALYNVTYQNNARDSFLYPDPWEFRVSVTAGF